MEVQGCLQTEVVEFANPSRYEGKKGGREKGLFFDLLEIKAKTFSTRELAKVDKRKQGKSLLPESTNN